jgi:cell fate regulator YaaT (PSP1 superfamily)
MPLVIGVRFNPATKVYYFDPTGFERLKPGEYVVVETARGEEVGQVIIQAHQVSDNEVVGQLKVVKRRASAVDLTQMSYYRMREQDALVRCEENVREHKLPMKVVRAEYNYDGSRLVFFFTAEKRVDFRRLVQELARSFRARIELRQIGVRDEAKLLGGIGKCGRKLCCATWLTEFSPVSIKMAKQQDLPLSPMEISGVCGRLLCCLAYENDQYAEVRRKLPKRGASIDTPHGSGKVVQVNVVKEAVLVELENQTTVEVPLDELLAPAQPGLRPVSKPKTAPKPKAAGRPKPKAAGKPKPKSSSRRRRRGRRRPKS